MRKYSNSIGLDYVKVLPDWLKQLSSPAKREDARVLIEINRSITLDPNDAAAYNNDGVAYRCALTPGAHVRPFSPSLALLEQRLRNLEASGSPARAGDP